MAISVFAGVLTARYRYIRIAKSRHIDVTLAAATVVVSWDPIPTGSAFFVGAPFETWRAFRQVWNFELQVPSIYEDGEGAVVIRLPLWPFLVGSGLVLTRGWLIRNCRKANKECLECGYSLIGNTTGRCPECGSIVETTVSRIDGL